MKELMIEIVNFLGLAYWVEIVTETPKCTYYFGPFLQAKAAENATEGYLEDLKNEGASGIKVQVKRCKPGDLTIFDEYEGKKTKSAIPSFT
ncbi:DUF1816 domain-containing protein [Gloeocapsa sp. PCC 73106]|uniref:DUF1816 domain-containing protein n=1 Tax=Gloeocapsa sp. PCC 73106 TaxID=102232 RepID=UPI0002ACB944|nr:DUF1816 domain-containing protein [Gloeocapsa sp. PCC 73106]ELR97942.1 protein of unknown function (DUF1816) [Gloeocapsa sp. PCC 73106]